MSPVRTSPSTRTLAWIGAAPLNPLRVTGTAMPPQLLLMAKLLTLCFLLRHGPTGFPGYFLPFFSVFNHLGPAHVLRVIVEILFFVAAALLFFNRLVRLASFVLGAILLLELLGSRPYYENNRLFTALLLILASLNASGEEPLLIRYQLVVLYVGASLNKILDADWRSGHFFTGWIAASPLSHAYERVSSLFPGMTLSTALAWTVMITEVLLAVAFLLKRLNPFAIWLGTAYHTTLLLMTGRTFGMFWFALLSSYLVLVDWPPGWPVAHLDVFYDASTRRWRNIRRLGETIDFERVSAWKPWAGERRFRVQTATTSYEGSSAAARLLLYNPATYLVIALCVADLPRTLLRLVAIIILAFLALFAYRFLTQRRALRAAAAT